jgi:hypothetical protein
MRPFAQRAVDLVIASGSDTSDVVPVRDAVLFSFKVPTLTGTALAVLGASRADETPTPINDSEGNAVSFAKPTADEWVTLSGSEADAVAAFPFIALKSDASEAAARTIRMVGKAP